MVAPTDLSGRVASMLCRIGQLYRTVMIASLGGDFGLPYLMIDLNLVCNVAESWCDQLSVCCYLQEERRGCLRFVLATLVF
jgi:hypothetical protein